MAQQNEGGSRKLKRIKAATGAELIDAISSGKIDPRSKELLNAELEFMGPPESGKKAAGGKNAGSRTGIALSGGGIRSATFSLGVLQALARHEKLEKMDYLSTVSGGGYIGSALTWWLSGKAGGEKFGTERKNFPYGSDDPSAPRDDAKQKGKPAPEAPKSSAQLTILKHLRQHGNYLIPGGGLGLTSGLAVVICGIFLNLLVWLPLLTALMVWLLSHGSAREFFAAASRGPLSDILAYVPELVLEGPLVFAGFVLLAVALAVIFAVCCMVFSILTFVSRAVPGPWYWLRRQVQIRAGQIILVIAVFAVAGSIPFIHLLIKEWLESVGAGAVAAGLLSGIMTFSKSGAENKGTGRGGLVARLIAKLPMSVVATVGCLLMIYGLLLIPYGIAHRLIVTQDTVAWNWFWFALSLAVITGLFVNLNYVSLHRFYRDRLMEAFLPNFNTVASGKTGAATAADHARLHEFGRTGRSRRPYHIVNTNLVLVDSLNRTFNTRGGDNFILSPLYCGGNATGWQPTEDFMGGRMTLATAMAISGAAANPNTGVAGEGLTRNPFVSLLMALLNIRLGYWVNNTRRKFLGRILPNHFSPGLYEIDPLGYRETRRFLQLSDGGHFENTAMYELVRRRLGLIIVCDGGADPKFAFADLQTAIRRIEADFGARVNFKPKELETLIPLEEVDFPKDSGVAKRGHIHGTITYADGTKGELIFMKTTMIPDLPLEVKGYKNVHRDFPDQPTADQFFDERQFEAYRELGYRTASAMIEDPNVGRLI